MPASLTRMGKPTPQQDAQNPLLEKETLHLVVRNKSKSFILKDLFIYFKSQSYGESEKEILVSAASLD